MSLDHAAQRVTQPCIGLHVVELGCFDQGRHDRPAVCPALAAGEQAVLATQSDRPDRPLDRVGVQVDAPIVEEPGQRRLAPERVADRLSKPAPTWQARQLQV